MYKFIPSDSTAFNLVCEDEGTTVSTYDGHILFNYEIVDEVVCIHFAMDKLGVRCIKQALKDFLVWIFKSNPSVHVLLTLLPYNKRSIFKLLMSLGCKLSLIGTEGMAITKTRSSMKESL